MTLLVLLGVFVLVGCFLSFLKDAEAAGHGTIAAIVVTLIGVGIWKVLEKRGTL
jgi:hypothetical protein